MPLVRFTQNLQRHVCCPDGTVAGTTVREVLESVFAENDRARAYVLDEHGHLRKHMMVFVDGKLIADRENLSVAVSANGTVDVMQALSGG
jgi:sulfur-carrier protein